MKLFLKSEMDVTVQAKRMPSLPQTQLPANNLTGRRQWQRQLDPRLPCAKPRRSVCFLGLAHFQLL